MIRISSFIALLMFTSASYAKDRDCDGTYNVYFDSHKVEYRKERGISAWIPATVEVRGALRQCVNTMSLKPLRSNQIVLKGPGYSLEGQLMDDGYRALNSAHGGRYLLPLSSSGTTQFWLRLPSAGFSPAGSYEARLQTKFLDEKLAPTRNVDINYVSLPVVSMRVPSTSEPWLSQSGNHYRVDMGEMTRGSTRDITLALRSNASVSVSIESKNGALKHQSLNNQPIDYLLKLNGMTWNPKIPFMSELGAVQSNRYTRIPFSIIVGPQPRAYAGQYSDRLTITVSAK